ncbi:MAG TPA: hypothetical protein VI669_09990, partial [Vicinamibacteria bacterium]
MRTKLPAMMLIAALSVLSCDDAPTQPPPESTGISIDSRILITPSERLSDGSRALVLKCRTERPYSCINYRIPFTVVRQGATVLVSFGKISLSGSVCLAAAGPATCAIDLGALAEGTYSLVFNSSTGNTRFDLLVEQGAYTVTPRQGSGVAFSPATLRRIPDETIWGLIGYVGPAGGPFDSLAGSFLDSLEAHGAEPVTLEPGEYGEFLIDSSGNMQWPGTSGYYVARPY